MKDYAVIAIQRLPQASEVSDGRLAQQGLDFRKAEPVPHGDRAQPMEVRDCPLARHRSNFLAAERLRHGDLAVAILSCSRGKDQQARVAEPVA